MRRHGPSAHDCDFLRDMIAGARGGQALLCCPRAGPRNRGPVPSPSVPDDVLVLVVPYSRVSINRFIGVTSLVASTPSATVRWAPEDRLGVRYEVTVSVAVLNERL